ncbi:hypothetical protein E6O75_ATG02970 [Venturia nashicola]|uniref:Uncharacterized protein n=1 Tax=Venturia nashicola TaxID=86259 RepID=A0A4Z1PM84_9PEZI|nr:hypothetical protein E6O75_ATG02970 [Venturia nashicola]
METARRSSSESEDEDEDEDEGMSMVKDEVGRGQPLKASGNPKDQARVKKEKDVLMDDSSDEPTRPDFHYDKDMRETDSRMEDTEFGVEASTKGTAAIAAEMEWLRSNAKEAEMQQGNKHFRLFVLTLGEADIG